VTSGGASSHESANRKSPPIGIQPQIARIQTGYFQTSLALNPWLSEQSVVKKDWAWLSNGSGHANGAAVGIQPQIAQIQTGYLKTRSPVWNLRPSE
jgi:hypothetical protein